MDLRLALMCGTDIPVPECQLILRQPKIKDIAFLGENTFFSGVQCLCINKSMFIKDETLLANTTNFQILMTIMSEKEAAEKKSAVIQTLLLFLPDMKVTFTPRSILLTGEQETVLIDENNFEYLQAAISSICCLRSGPMDQHSFNPANEQARKIAEKLMRGRQIASAQKGENNASTFGQYISILTVGLNSMSLQDVVNLTMYQLYDLIERYMLYISWDMDIRSRLAGGKPETKPDNWMKNIH